MAGVRVQRGKRAIHRAENPIDQLVQFAQRMPLRNPLLQAPVAEHRMPCPIRRSHLLQPRHDKAAIISLASIGRGFLSNLLEQTLIMCVDKKGILRRGMAMTGFQLCFMHVEQLQAVRDVIVRREFVGDITLQQR